MIDVRESNTKLFSCLSIETGAKCNRHCAFCPVSHAPRDDEWMPDEMIKKIIDDLVSLDYRQRIVLHSYNEPTRDPRMVDILKEIRLRLPRVCIQFNTNGDFLRSVDDVKKYFIAGLNQMQINIYNATDGCGDDKKIQNGIAKCEARFKMISEWVLSIDWLTPGLSIYQHIGADRKTCEVVPKWNFQPTTSHDNSMPSRKHDVSVRHHIANRAGNVPNFMPALDEPLSKMCVRPFREMVINWRGDAILCCNDYHAEASSGNVMDKTLTELFNDARYHAYRVKLQAKNRDIHLCNHCDYTGGYYQHNVPHVTFGAETDSEIINADMRSSEAAGFTQLIQIGRRS